MSVRVPVLPPLAVPPILSPAHVLAVAVVVPVLHGQVRAVLAQVGLGGQQVMRGMVVVVVVGYVGAGAQQDVLRIDGLQGEGAGWVGGA